MARKQESLRNLIESGAAFHSKASRAVCRWVLDAILRNELRVIFPEGESLDTKFSHGGMPLTWRLMLGHWLHRIEHIDPSRFVRFQRLSCEPTLFDRWLKAKLQTNSSPEASRFPVRKRPSPAQVRQVVQNYVNEERKIGRSTSITRMWKYVQKEPPNATRDQAINALRDIEGGPKERGRPRRATPVRN
jgi:hypothetical protein